MKISSLFACLFLCVTSLQIFAQTADAELRLNHIQVKGTHNSYHLESLGIHPSHKYSHLSLTDQLDKRGIRAFELDVHQALLGSDLAVYHIGLIDGKSSCAKFKDCLQELKAWSDLHPDHVTIFVWIEIKDETGGPKFVNFDQVDAEIFEVLGDRLVIPDHVLGGFDSLQEAVREGGWPSVADTRGKFMFMLDQDDRTKNVYLKGKSLEGRLMFPRASEQDLEEPWAVVAKAQPGDFHRAALSRNFLLSDNICSAGNASRDCFMRLQDSTAAGTHLLMDDFEGGAPAQMNEDYFVQFPNGFKANCNLSTKVSDCEDSLIDWY